MTAPLRHSQRGFSLPELLVSMVIGLIVIAGALALLMGQQKNFASTSEDRYLQEIARIVVDHMTNNLQQAGYGVDPGLVFDLGPMSNVRMERGYGGSGATFSTNSVAKGDGSACTGLCRDSTTAPDEIVFYARDPTFGPHPITVALGSTSSSLRVAGPIRTTISPGQVLQVVCYASSMTWAYVKVSGAVTVNGDNTTTIPIASTNSNFPMQNASFADSCFSSTATMAANAITSMTNAALVFKVDRYHYYIQSYDSSGNVRSWGTAGTRPFLMFDQGLTDSSGNVIKSVIAPDVEDLQFAYVFPRDTTTPLAGGTPGTAITNDNSGINLAPTPTATGCPVYSDDLTMPPRLNHHPGNIGAVRVSVVVRSASADVTRTDNTIPAAGNRNAVAGASGYSRLSIDTTVNLRNMTMLNPYFPYYTGTGTSSAVTGNRQYNVGGG